MVCGALNNGYWVVKGEYFSSDFKYKRFETLEALAKDLYEESYKDWPITELDLFDKSYWISKDGPFVISKSYTYLIFQTNEIANTYLGNLKNLIVCGHSK